MKIEKAEYEELLRDAERLKLIRILTDADCIADTSEAVMLICEYIKGEKLKGEESWH